MAIKKTEYKQDRQTDRHTHTGTHPDTQRDATECTRIRICDGKLLS